MTILTSWSHGLKLKLLFMIIMFTLSILIVESLSNSTLQRQKNDTELLAHDRMPKIVSLLRLRVNAEAAVRFLWAATGFENLDIRKNKLENAKQRFEKFESEYQHFLSLKPSQQVEAQSIEMFKNWKKIEGLSQQVRSNLLQGQKAEDETAKQLMENQLIPLYLKQIEVINSLEKIIQEQVDQTVLTGEQESLKSERLLIAVGGLSMVGLLIFGIFFARSLANSLGLVSQNVNDAGMQLNSASQQLSTASQSLSTGAVQSASSMQETVSSLEELSSIVKLNAEHAVLAANLAEQSNKAAKDGEVEIKELIEAMTEITESSKKIEEIINVIDDIAFQTNLLSLNAAVEAARAGEQGKGFAVVAEAVRSLAQRSALAAKDINTLIKEAGSKTMHGSQIADKSGGVLSEILNSVKKVSELNNEIATASSEQSLAIQQINKVMNEMDSATQKNAASAEEVAASSVELSAQASSLQRLVLDLNKIVVGGH